MGLTFVVFFFVLCRKRCIKLKHEGFFSYKMKIIGYKIRYDNKCQEKLKWGRKKIKGSVRFRIKDEEHLIEKNIRKKVEYEDTHVEFNQDTYLDEITDIIGIRALYVFKSDYLPLHKDITSIYKRSFCEKPQVKLREGDDKSIYQGLRNVEFQYGVDYRSIHNTIRHIGSNGLMVPVEIQTLGDLMKSIAERGDDVDILDDNILAEGRSVIDDIIKGKQKIRAIIYYFEESAGINHENCN